MPTPLMSAFHVVGPTGIYIFQTDALYGTSLHVSSAHEPDGGQGMPEGERHGSVGVPVQFIRLCHEKVFLLIDIDRNGHTDDRRTGICAAGKHIMPVVFRSVCEEPHFV